jgi:N-acetylneuraminic acid mutarotase
MIVWGGRSTDGYLNTGGKYNPAADTWTATSTTDSAEARVYHTAIWTGTEMIVWGGYRYYDDGSYKYFDTGGVYNPVSDSWTATSTTNAPGARYVHTAVWIGTEMIIWGGYSFTNTGGRYYPGLSDGSHSFSVRAYDASFNVDPTPATYSWTVDITPPVTYLSSAPAYYSDSTDATFEFYCTKTGCTFECNLDSTGWAGCSSPSSYFSLAAGGHVFSVRATDLQGSLEVSPLIYSWTIQP